jgi:hypothetical protein
MARWLVFVLTAAVWLACATAARAQIEPGERIDLTTTLEKGLKVPPPRFQRERHYIQRVVRLVQQGVFSKELVLSVFQQARQRHHSYPFIYFRTMMSTIAQRQGVELTY